ncbi:MAG: ABC transporter substrate-binding protein [Alphaproteobacteria bacterium]|nr:MAG: ABC transporter substrate-binding protein [Alphaproteobacteria bacterium]
MGLLHGRLAQSGEEVPMLDMRRRKLIAMLGGAAAAWPLAARAQQPALPVVGFLDNRSSDGMASRLAAFHKGLKEVGLVEGENVTIVYRWAEDRLDRLPEMASELARQATVIVTTGGPPAAFAAKAATTTVPIVFLVGEDPTRLGLVTSIARPSGNLTGINMLANELEAKRLQLLHQLVPQAQRVAVLVNPNSVINAETTLRDVEPAARTIGLQLQVLKASTAREIEEAFAWSEGQRPDALFVAATAFLNIRRVQLVQLAAFHRLAATFGQREAAEAGALMSYGPSILEGYRQWGIYAGRVLKGAKPGELPVLQSTKFELVINNTTARMFGLTVPPSLVAIADEVIE